MSKKCERPCAGCPWLKANQTPEAVAASPVDGSGEHWFSERNLLRHWAAAGKIGAMLPCHKTDENAHLYGGTAAKKQDARICVGLSTLAYREVFAFMSAGQSFERYRALKGRRWTAVGLAAWAARLFFAGATFHVGGRAYTMPKIAKDDPRLGLPWNDSVHDPTKKTVNEEKRRIATT